MTESLKRKNPIKTKKQKLINRINQCKTLKEIKGREKTFFYHDILGYENQKERDELKCKKCKENNCVLIEFPYSYDDKIYNNKIKK